MKQLAKILRLDFLPQSSNLALLVLRVWIGLSMFFLHGLDKLVNFSAKSEKFMNFMGMGSTASLALAVFAEAICSVLLVLGLFTRFAALSCAITMSVAFFITHEGMLSGPRSGELAFIYFAAFVTLFLAGGGRFSIDAKMGGKV